MDTTYQYFILIRKKAFIHIFSERNSRVKEASGIDLSYLDKIDMNGVPIGVTSTQNWPVMYDPSCYNFDIESARRSSFTNYLQSLKKRDENGFQHLTKTTRWIEGIDDFDAT